MTFKKDLAIICISAIIGFAGGVTFENYISKPEYSMVKNINKENNKPKSIREFKNNEYFRGNRYLRNGECIYDLTPKNFRDNGKRCLQWNERGLGQEKEYFKEGKQRQGRGLGNRRN